MSSTKMKVISTKVPPTIHEQLTAEAQTKGISLSEFLRHFLTEVYNGRPNGLPESTEIDQKSTEVDRTLSLIENQIAEKDKQLTEKDKQLEEKDKQISELHQLLAIQSKTSAQLTEQLEAIKQLEDMRQRASWWGRLFRK